MTRFYTVTVAAECEMIVEVEARNAAEAKKAVRRGNYEPLSQWEERMDRPQKLVVRAVGQPREASMRPGMERS